MFMSQKFWNVSKINLKGSERKIQLLEQKYNDIEKRAFILAEENRLFREYISQIKELLKEEN